MQLDIQHILQMTVDLYSDLRDKKRLYKQEKYRNARVTTPNRIILNRD